MLSRHIATSGEQDAHHPGHRTDVGYDAHQHLAPVVGDRFLMAIDVRAKASLDRLDEVAAVERRLKPEDAAAEQSFEQIASPRTDLECLPIRPRDVPEGDDTAVRQAFADQERRECEVIVLHQHER